MFKTLAIMIFVPIILAELTRTFAHQQIIKARPAFNAITVILLCLIIYIVTAGQQSHIINNLNTILIHTVYLFILFIALQIIGYYLTPNRPKEDRIAISVSKTFMNNSLAIVLAYEFFAPEIIVITVLSEIPWAVMLAPFNAIVHRKS